MDSLFPKFVQPAPDIVWRPEIEAGAGVYLLGSALRFVTEGSPTEREVIAAGGVRVGTLRFDRDLTERSHRHRPVQALPAGAALRELQVSAERN
ncbi:MAG: hypothetical protein KY464_04595 [Gemmatimonadetes bacterium]|nr:hypothetical protein [Gemmatimonadota bacterium]